MNYRDVARDNDQVFSTGIHTRINKEVRVSSMYRRFSNSNFEYWGWETFVWENDAIKYEYSPLDSADEVVDLHTTIVNEFV